MALKFVCGEKKTGKTAYILNELKKNKNSIIIVPEQTLFLYEKKILNELSEEHSFNIQILSFKKLALKLLHDDEKFNRIKLLDADTKALLIEKILLNNKDKLTVLKNAASNPAFSEKISTQISEFKKYLIGFDKINELADTKDLDKKLKDKLSDIGLIYGEYENKINDVYLDLDDLLVTAANKISKNMIYKNSNIYIDSFTGFTGEELYMIDAFLKSGANVTVALTLLKERSLNNGDIGFTVKKTYDKLKKLAAKNEIPINEIVLDTSFFDSREIEFLAKSFDLYCDSYENTVSDISIIRCRNLKYECENLASKIVEDIKYNNARPAEMAVVVPDIKEYSDYIKENFEKFNISFYSNEKKSVYDMPVAALINNIFNIILSGNRMDVIIAYLKSGYFFKGEEEKIYKFESFIKSTGVRAYQLMKKPFSEIIEDKKAYNFIISDEEVLTDVYNKAIYPVICLKENILSKKTAEDYSYALFEYFNKISLPDTLSEYASEYELIGDITTARQLIQVYNYILESMERTTLVLSDVKVSFDEYKSIIVSALKNKNISSIPVLCDSILLTEPEGFFNDSYKYIYVIGVNDGKIPKVMSTEGIINEEERQLLMSFGIELSMSAEMKITENRFKIFDVLTSPSKKLYLSYPEYSKSGAELEGSYFINEIKEMFLLNEEKENIVYSTKRYLLKDVLSSISQKNIEKNKENIAYLSMEEEYFNLINNTLSKLKDFSFGKVKKLLGSSIRVSTTNMEKYNSCAFSYFIRYVLRAKENEEYSINSAGLGTVMHLILEMFSLKLKKDNMDFSQVDDSYIRKNLDSIIKDASHKVNNGVFNSDIKSEVFKRKIYSTAYKTINLIRQHFIKGSFIATGFEVDFGREESELEGIAFDVGDGRKVILNGVIDRVDKFTKDGCEYIRIVDYKSSQKTLDFYEVVTGLKMQLAVYLMNAMGKESIDKIKPGGMLYLTLKSPVITISSPTEEDTVEAKIKEKLTMKGFYLNTSEIAEAMDEGFKENHKSEIVDLELDKSGIPKNKNTLSLEEFKTLLSYVRTNVEKGGKKIFDGEFSINPVKVNQNTACDYCPYGAVCMFDNENSEMKNITKIPRDEIFTGS